MESQGTGRESKGKGKGTDAEPIPAEPPSRSANDGKLSGPSLSQMAQSAAAVLLSGPPAAGLSGANEKGESSRASEALARAGESSVQLRPNAPGGQTMRTGHAQEHIAQEEASFSAFLDSEGALGLSEPSSLETAWQSAAPGPTVSQAMGVVEMPSRSTAHQEAKDGADVVALLSSDGELDQVFDHVNEPPSQDELARLRKALFGEGTEQTTSSIAWDNVLNFVPEYLQAPAPSGMVRQGDLITHLGVSDPALAWETWMTDWSRVLTNYQDEVWGDLAALADEARSEVRRIEEAKPGEKPPEPTALLRLRAILGHLRGA